MKMAYEPPPNLPFFCADVLVLLKRNSPNLYSVYMFVSWQFLVVRFGDNSNYIVLLQKAVNVFQMCLHTSNFGVVLGREKQNSQLRFCHLLVIFLWFDTRYEILYSGHYSNLLSGNLHKIGACGNA